MQQHHYEQRQERQPGYLNLPLTQAIKVTEDLRSKNYSQVNSLLGKEDLASEEWIDFQNSWNNLPNDNFMKDNGRYRTRRYSVFTWKSGTQQLIIEPKQPHYQEVDFNNLNGGIERHYELFEESTILNPIFNQIMGFNMLVLEDMHPNQDWHIEAHQFRITSTSDQIGLPTPEGVHRDGRHYVMIMFIGKHNLKGGDTTIYDLNNKPIFQHCMKNPSETIFLNDEQVMHGVSPLTPINPTQVGTRDVMVITYYKKLSSCMVQN